MCFHFLHTFLLAALVCVRFDFFRSHSALIQQCLRIIWLLCAVYDLDIMAEHIPGYLNIIADLLSRWSQDPLAVEKFYSLPDANTFNFCDCSSNMFDLSFDISTIEL